MNRADNDRNPAGSLPARATIEAHPEKDGPVERELTRNPNGQSLTLLEEYRRSKIKTGKRAFYFRLACAAASLTFAFLTYQKL